MRLTIDHRTLYRFSEPQARVVQLLRMTPHDSGAQTVTEWSIDVNCDARLRQGRDGYGNNTTMLYIDGPVTSVELIVRGEVLTDDQGGLTFGVPETLAPPFYLRETQLTAASPEIRDLAHQLAGTARDSLTRARNLTIDLFERIATVRGRTPKSRTVSETLAEGSGNVRDKAQLLIALARAAGLPARFVSGHWLEGYNLAHHKSAHCWTEIHIDGTGWLGFDPTTGLHPGESYVRVAIGLDASDATPLSGTRTGGGIEELDVDVRVQLAGAQTQ